MDQYDYEDTVLQTMDKVEQSMQITQVSKRGQANQAYKGYQNRKSRKTKTDKQPTQPPQVSTLVQKPEGRFSLGKIIAVSIVCVLFFTVMYFWGENEVLKFTVMSKDTEISHNHDQILDLEKDKAALQLETTRQNTEINRLASVLQQTKEKLTETNITLEQVKLELEKTEADLQNRIRTLQETREELSQLQDDLLEVEESINESIQWFKDNSLLPPSAQGFVPYVENRCVENGMLNLACVSLFMDRNLGIRYIDESTDRLYSLEEIIARGGGDCEDFSIFFKAILNSISADGKQYKLVAWEEGPGTFKVYESGSSYWYYHGSAKTIGTLGKVTPYEICYVTSASDQLIQGHCVVALSQAEVKNKADLQKLDGAFMFEPQDGGYVGLVGKTVRLCKDNDARCEKTVGSVIAIISDNDIYQFRDGKWKSLNEYLDTAETLRTQITTASKD